MHNNEFDSTEESSESSSEDDPLDEDLLDQSESSIDNIMSTAIKPILPTDKYVVKRWKGLNIDNTALVPKRAPEALCNGKHTWVCGNHYWNAAKNQCKLCGNRKQCNMNPRCDKCGIYQFKSNHRMMVNNTCMVKYYLKKRELFPFADDQTLRHIVFTDEGLYSATPFVLSSNICVLINNFSTGIILDLCCGIGADTVTFSKIGNFSRILSNDINIVHMETTRMNSRLFGCDLNKMEFFCHDMYQIPHDIVMRCDSVYIDVPWGGVSYKNGVSDLEICIAKLDTMFMAIKPTLKLFFKVPVNFTCLAGFQETAFGRRSIKIIYKV